jgi:hypothetical protein
MRSTFRVKVAHYGSHGTTRLQEVLDILLEWRGSNGRGTIWPELPEWLRRSFSPELSPDEAKAWLANWRSASPEEREHLERERGWGYEDWVYWFSAENDIWHLVSVTQVSESMIDVQIEHSDDPFPFKALDWLVEKAGCVTESIARVA